MPISMDKLREVAALLIGRDPTLLPKFRQANKEADELASKILQLLSEHSKDPASTLIALATVTGSTLSFIDRTKSYSSPEAKKLSRQLLMNLIEEECSRFSRNVPVD